MAERKPVLLAVDDDREVVRAVERDLRNHYARDFTVLAAGSGEEALELVRRLVPRGDPLALVVTDQRMPRMTGVELLAHVAADAPDAKRVLLTAYADTEVAMRAINEIRLDHYLDEAVASPRGATVSGARRPARRLACRRVARTGPRGCGRRCRVCDRRIGFSAGSQRVRDLLANNQIAYRWLDVQDSRAGQMLAQASLTADRLPVVLVPDAEPLVDPDPAEVAERIGLQTDEELAYYDLVVVGAGPAGLAAAVYGASEGLRTVVVERQSFGGQAGMSSRIENYLGFPAGLSGADLARRATTQARRFGCELLTAQEAVGIDVVGNTRVVRLGDGSSIASHTVLLAPGVSYRRLDCRGRRPAHRARHLVRHGLRRATLPCWTARKRSSLAERTPQDRRRSILQRDARDDPLPRREPPEVDVAVPRRTHRVDAGRDHGPPQHGGRGGPRREPLE